MLNPQVPQHPEVGIGKTDSRAEAVIDSGTFSQHVGMRKNGLIGCRMKAVLYNRLELGIAVVNDQLLVFMPGHEVVGGGHVAGELY